MCVCCGRGSTGGGREVVVTRRWTLSSLAHVRYEPHVRRTVWTNALPACVSSSERCVRAKPSLHCMYAAGEAAGADRLYLLHVEAGRHEGASSLLRPLRAPVLDRESVPSCALTRTLTRGRRRCGHIFFVSTRSCARTVVPARASWISYSSSAISTRAPCRSTTCALPTRRAYEATARGRPGRLPRRLRRRMRHAPDPAAAATVAGSTASPTRCRRTRRTSCRYGSPRSPKLPER